MEIILVLVFVLGYVLIATEHLIKINKAATALLTAIICWTVIMVSPVNSQSHTKEYELFSLEKQETIKGMEPQQVETAFITYNLSHHLAGIAQILFFLLGAMTIVEIVDQHHGFRVITDRIKTQNMTALLWITSVLAFLLSSVLDNLTTCIVMVSLLKKLVQDKEQRMFFAGMIIIAANAGGAWSPIGDVTTTMLWIGGQITAVNIVKMLILPCIICLLVPLVYLTFKLSKQVLITSKSEASLPTEGYNNHSNLMLTLGIGALLFVPIFKTVTHLPPYMGMLLGLAVLWVVSEIIKHKKPEDVREYYSVSHALTKIDTPSVLFFLGILLAISALESAHLLSELALWMNDSIGRMDIIVLLIGGLSAVVDNVPLVAASMGMYDMATYPTDHWMWEFMAYCAGTGGSMLIIGSAAGVAVMGLEKIKFIWYFKHISLLALLGYVSGALFYLLVH